jgi:hypothetical protein
MRPLPAIVLAVLGVVCLVGGWFLGPGATLAAQQSVAAGTLAFPDLAPKLQQAAQVQIEHDGKTMSIVRHGDVWGLADRGGYPVQTDKLRGLLTALTELRLVEPRTADAAELERLGLGDPTRPGSTADLLRVLDASGKPIAELVTGHRRMRTGGDVPEDVYVRRPNQTQAWLAEGTLEVEDDPSVWLDRDIANIDHAGITSVKVTHPDGTTLEFAVQGDKPVMTAPADHPKLDDYKMDDVFRAYEFLTFNDVKRGPDLPGTPVGQSDFTTEDGMVVHANVHKDGDNVWVAFDASGKGDAAKIEATVKGWVYQMGGYKAQSLAPTLDDLKAAPPAPAAAAAPAPTK